MLQRLDEILKSFPQERLQDGDWLGDWMKTEMPKMRKELISEGTYNDWIIRRQNDFLAHKQLYEEQGYLPTEATEVALGISIQCMVVNQIIA